MRTDHRVRLTRRSACGFDPVDIFFGIFELQRVFCDFGHRHYTQRVFIKDRGKTFGRTNAAMKITFRADRLVFLKLLKENHRVTAFAFMPKRFCRFALGDERHGIADAGYPIHV